MRTLARWLMTRCWVILGLFTLLVALIWSAFHKEPSCPCHHDSRRGCWFR